jgi:hypothetical protein
MMDNNQLLINIPIYVINLERRKDRREKIKKKIDQLRSSGIKLNYTFFDAVDGSDEKWNGVYRIMRKKGNVMSRGSMGIILTYIKLLKYLHETSDERVIIFEDDISFHRMFKELWISNYDQIVSDKYHFFWLGANIINPIDDQIIRKKYQTVYGGFGIMFTRTMINILIQSICSSNLWNVKHIDVMFNQILDNHNLMALIIRPYLVIPDVTDSDTQQPRNMEIFCNERGYFLEDYMV